MRRDGGLPEIRTLTITTKSSHVDNVTITLDGDAKSVAVTNGADLTVTANEIAAGDYSDTGRGWKAEAEGDTVVFTSWDASARTGTYSLTDATSAVGTFAQTVVGVAPTETAVAQTAWSADKAANGQTLPTIDFTKGNVFQIRYQWLGFGAIEFSIEDPVTGRLTLVHRIEYANANTEPSVHHPSLPLQGISENVANDSSLVVKLGSMGGFIEGRDLPIGVLQSKKGTSAAIGSTRIPILSLKNKSVYQSRLNRASVKLNSLALASDATKSLTISIHINPTLTAAAFADVDTNTSVMSADTSATATTGGDLIFETELAKVDTLLHDLNSIRNLILPGDVWSLSAVAVSGSGHELDAVFNWDELL